MIKNEMDGVWRGRMTEEEVIRKLKAIRSDYEDDIKRYRLNKSPVLKFFVEEANALDEAIKMLEAHKITGVIIPGASLPRNCHECGAFGISDVVGLEDECPVAKKTEPFDFQERPEGCPLVEVKNENN